MNDPQINESTRELSRVVEIASVIIGDYQPSITQSVTRSLVGLLRKKEEVPPPNHILRAMIVKAEASFLIALLQVLFIFDKAHARIPNRLRKSRLQPP